MELEEGDPENHAFSFMSERKDRNKRNCWLTYTNEKTHEIIRENIMRAPKYAGKIHGIGARYCPSIEDKVVRFADKDRHQLFVEPEGLDTTEMYVQGMSTSMPIDVQYAFLRTIPGFEDVKMMRPAYAIEYDLLDPLQLYPTLEVIKLPGLYSAGQSMVRAVTKRQLPRDSWRGSMPRSKYREKIRLSLPAMKHISDLS